MLNIFDTLTPLRKSSVAAVLPKNSEVLPQVPDKVALTACWPAGIVTASTAHVIVVGNEEAAKLTSGKVTMTSARALLQPATRPKLKPNIASLKE